MTKAGARILVVDDEKEILRALQRNLSAHGYEIFTAKSGEEALEEIANHRPDLMLLDLGLPGLSRPRRVQEGAGGVQSAHHCALSQGYRAR